MADEFKGIGNETLRNVEALKSSMKEIAEATNKTNKSLREQTLLSADYASSFSKISSSANKFAELQDKAKRSASATSEAFKEQQKQLSVVRSLNAQIDNLYDQMLDANEKQEKVLKKQVNNLSAARDNAQELAKEFEDLVNDSSKLDKSTMWFSALSQVVTDIPGLRKLSSPFEAAAKASRETALNNAKNKAFLDEALETGKGLTKEKIKELGFEKEAGGLTGKAAAAKLKAAGVVAKTESVGIAGLQAGFKALGPIISGALGPLAIITTVISAVKALIDMMFEADKQVTDLAKSLNVSKDAARDVRDRFFDIADRAEYLGTIQKGNLINQKDLVETQLQLNQALGISVDLSQEQNEEFAVQLTNARKFLKLSEEETKGLVGLYSTTGKSIDEIKNSVLGTTRLRKIESGIMLDERKILKDVLTTSNAIKLSVKGGLEGLTKAAMAAAELGSDLKTVENISKGLLNFEESISSELEAELLIGRDLNLETARRAALNGDLETVAREINRQVGSSADFSRMNVIQQEALAKAMGTSRDELADMLVQQENLNKLRSRFNVLGAKTIQNLFDEQKINKTTFDRLSGGTASATEYYDALKQAGMAQKEIVELLGDEAAQSLESQSAQDKFNDALEKAKEIFTRFVDGESLDKFADFISRFVESVNRNGLGSTLLFGMDSESDIAKSKAEEYRKKAESEEDASKKEEFLKKAADQDKKYQEALKRENDEYMEEAKSGAMGAEQRKAAEVIERSKRGESGIMYAGSGPKFADGGMITKPVYNATIGEAGPEAVVPLTEFYAKIDQLISAVNKGGNVYLDLQKVGSTTDQGTYRLNS